MANGLVLVIRNAGVEVGSSPFPTAGAGAVLEMASETLTLTGTCCVCQPQWRPWSLSPPLLASALGGYCF